MNGTEQIPRAKKKYDPAEMLNASDIRQYMYCPRIIYFNYVVVVPRHTTLKMEKGKTAQEDFSRLEKRRTLAKWGLEDGQREFHVPVKSEKMGLYGVLDMVITSDSGLYPVEYKNTLGRVGIHHKYQLIAYAMMLEEERRRPVREGFIYLIPQNRLEKFLVDEGARFYTKKLCTQMRNLIDTQTFPEATRKRERCKDCEFRNYCRDT